MTKYQLMLALCGSNGADVSRSPNYLSFTDSRGKGHCGLIQSVQREDGSGSSFNVSYRGLTNGAVCTTVHVRTID